MLSQAEIDALLNGSIEIDAPDTDERVNLASLMDGPQGGPAANAPKKEDRQIQPYNFWSPDRFSKEQMRAIEMIHEDLAERLTASLPSFLRTNLRPRVVHSEQGRFHDFLKDVPASSLFHIITLSPLPGQMVLTISPEIGYTILELRLGGKTERTSRQRGLTEIDQLLLRGMVEHMLNDIKAAWSKLVVVEPGLDDTTVNYHWVQMVMGNERVMLVAFEMSVQSVTGTMNVYIPFTLLKPIAHLLNPYVWISGQKERTANAAEHDAVMANLSRITLPLRVLLGNVDLTMQDLLELREGDVIPLDQSVNDDLAVEVANRIRFMARPGRQGNHLAAQITSVIENVETPLDLNLIANQAK
jgi:flagellar motor switch protein FliM